MRLLSVGNALLLGLTMVVGALAIAAVWVSLPSHDGPREGDVYPLPQESEFPVATEEDRVLLENVVARLFRDLDWTSASSGTLGWSFGDLGILTLDGERAGVYGIVTLDSAADLSGRSSLVLCGSALGPKEWNFHHHAADVFYIALLDDRSQPYHVLPVADLDTRPQARDFAQNAMTSCGSAGSF